MTLPPKASRKRKVPLHGVRRSSSTVSTSGRSESPSRGTESVACAQNGRSPASRVGDRVGDAVAGGDPSGGDGEDAVGLAADPQRRRRDRGRGRSGGSGRGRRRRPGWRRAAPSSGRGRRPWWRPTARCSCRPRRRRRPSRGRGTAPRAGLRVDAQRRADPLAAAGRRLRPCAGSRAAPSATGSVPGAARVVVGVVRRDARRRAAPGRRCRRALELLVQGGGRRLRVGAPVDAEDHELVDAGGRVAPLVTSASVTVIAMPAASAAS